MSRTYNPAAQAQQWAEAEVDAMVTGGDPNQRGAVDLAEVYGVTVAWGPAPTPHPSGATVNVPTWFLSITRPSPIPGTPLLFACEPIGAPEPDEAAIRGRVRNGIAAIRTMHATQAAAAQNGQPPQ